MSTPSSATAEIVLERLGVSSEAIAAFCNRNRIDRLELFGSILRSDFENRSDVDVLVTFAPDAGHGLFDLVRIQDELAALLRRSVDLVERGAIAESENYIRRRSILGSARTIYERA